MSLSKETKDRIKKEARAMCPLDKDSQATYILGAEEEAERAAGLVEKLIWLEGWVSDRHGSDNPISKEIRETLTKYNNGK